MEPIIREEQHVLPERLHSSHHNHFHPQNFNKTQTRQSIVQKKLCSYPKDTDSIDILCDEARIMPLKLGSKSMGRKQGLLWTHRDQANMNQYEIDTSGRSKSTSNVETHLKSQDWENPISSNSEYSYAYCEPIIKKISNNSQLLNLEKAKYFPSSEPNKELPKTLKSSRSIRVLLSKSFRKSSVSNPNERHTFTTLYGKKENIYEDVDRVLINHGTKPKQSFSSETIKTIPVDEELKLVEAQHNRIMSELNLSMEELLMPSQSETDELDFQKLSNVEQYCSKPENIFSSHIQYNPNSIKQMCNTIDQNKQFNCNYSNQENRKNFTINRAPGPFQNSCDVNVCIMQEKSNSDPISPHKDNITSYSYNSNNILNQQSTNNSIIYKVEKRIETISEKVNLRNTVGRAKDMSTKSRSSCQSPL
uniref:CSON011300 protein n=1 Tax=Culicoides sonorensis TaxID=179676 RepID=A0A336LR22_CULSO